MSDSGQFYLNCYLLGDETYDSFPIRVSQDLRIFELKAMIVDAYQRTMGDRITHPHLYQIDVLADVEDLAGIVIPPQKMCLRGSHRVGDFWKDPQQIVERHVQVLVEAEVSPPVGQRLRHAPNHDQLGSISLVSSATARLRLRRDQTAEAFRNAPSASAAAGHQAFEHQQALDDIPIFNGRPQRRTAVPIQLFHPAFDYFAAQIKEPVSLISEEYILVEDLLLSAQDFYDGENTRWNAMKDLLSAVIGHLIQVEPITKCESGGAVIFSAKYRSRKAYGAIVTIENEIGTGGCDPYIQGAQVYSRRWSQTKVDDLRKATRCPSLIISVAGPWIIFHAISATITYLDNYYAPLIANMSALSVDNTICFPYFQTVQTSNGPLDFSYQDRLGDPNVIRPVFKAITKDNRVVVVKFAQCYNFEAHKLLADHSLAPKLISRDAERVGGGLLMIVMELSGTSLDNYTSNPKFDLSLFHQVRKDIETALAILHAKNLVFGDLRPPNVLINKGNDGIFHEAKFPITSCRPSSRLIMWERTLSDLIRGLRANKGDESQFIAKAVDEIRTEVKSKDMDLKAAAVLKLVYLEMLGYPMGWASFYVVEVMSSPKLHLKAVGYLAAVQTFTADTDVLMLTTNLLKKDLSNAMAPTLPMVLNGFSHLTTPDLSRDLASDVFALLTHSKPSVRKSAVVSLFKLLLTYPDALPIGIERLNERLGDDDPGVVSATVNVLCELARRSPDDYLVLAPQLFHLLTTASNNWMLIKIVKLFGLLAPHEARLAKKLTGPLADLIANTPAISLLYECVHTVIVGGMLQGSMARACSAKLAVFLGDADQNLKYIALLAMAKIAPTHAHLVAEHQDVIFSSIEDSDMSIRMRALELLTAMANRDNIQSIVQQLLDHLIKPPSQPSQSASSALRALASGTASTPTPAPIPAATPSKSQTEAYRLVVARRILHMLSRDAYSAVPDFEWALSVLIDLTYIISLAAKCIADEQFWGLGAWDVVGAAVWVCGEYASELDSPLTTLLDLLQPAALALPGALCVQNALKVFGFWAADRAERWDDATGAEVLREVERTSESLRAFAKVADPEVQERAANGLQLFRFIQADVMGYEARRAATANKRKEEPESGDAQAESEDAQPETETVPETESSEPNYPKSMYLLQPLRISFELNYVAPHAQSSVPVPDGLNLDAWIVPPPKAMDFHEEEQPKRVKKKSKGKEKEKERDPTKKRKSKKVEETPEEKAAKEQARAERLERQKDDPYYISDKKPTDTDDVDSIPVVKLEGVPSPAAEGPSSRFVGFKPRSVTSQVAVVDVAGEMPAARLGLGVHTPASGRGSSTATPPPRPTAPVISSFPQYEVEDEPRAAAPIPEPIKVTKVKKKKAKSKPVV
ncbi:adaptin amino-terminal region protein, partial [Rhizoctonia solani AG-3 Rhs1AP]